MDTSPDLRGNRSWRTAVWSLRVGYVGLVVAIVGLVVRGSGSGPGILAVGVVWWLLAAAATLTAFFRARAGLTEPRPTFWSMRMALVRDSVRPRR